MMSETFYFLVLITGFQNNDDCSDFRQIFPWKKKKSREKDQIGSVENTPRLLSVAPAV